jgi:NADH-quinone oxidoreductase subunit C
MSLVETNNAPTMTEIKIPEAQIKLRQSIIAEFGDLLLEREALAWKEYGLCFEVQAENLLSVMGKLKVQDSFKFEMLIDVTAVDWMDRREMRYEVIYHLLSISHNHRLCVRSQLPENNSKISSVRSLWHSANFLEREVWDMFGIEFQGHGDLRRILMYDEFVGHPLRKDYPVKQKQPRIELRVPELKNTAVEMRREQLVALPSRRSNIKN